MKMLNVADQITQAYETLNAMFPSSVLDGFNDAARGEMLAAMRELQAAWREKRSSWHVRQATERFHGLIGQLREVMPGEPAVDNEQTII